MSHLGGRRASIPRRATALPLRKRACFPETICNGDAMSSVAKSERLPLLAAGIFGLTGVTLGALGAHALKATLIERGMMNAWETAARYHLFHAVALLGLAAWMRAEPGERSTRALRWATHCWSWGIVLFSASLYWLAVGGPRWLGPVTPLGGVALMVGWLLVLKVAWQHGRG